MSVTITAGHPNCQNDHWSDHPIPVTASGSDALSSGNEVRARNARGREGGEHVLRARGDGVEPRMVVLVVVANFYLFRLASHDLNRALDTILARDPAVQTSKTK